jgi:hypothetical protein
VQKIVLAVGIICKDLEGLRKGVSLESVGRGVRRSGSYSAQGWV